MQGDKWIVKEDVILNNTLLFKKGDVLIEKKGYNFETERREECGNYNELHNHLGFVCDVGSKFAEMNLEKINK